MTAAGDPRARALREAMLEVVRARGGAVTGPVAAALRTVPRHLFVPEVSVETAYEDEAIVTKQDAAGLPISSSSQPTIMAIMLDQLGVEPGHRVLEIGAGTGYNAALLAHLVGPAGAVVSVDIDQEVVDRARTGLAGTDVTVVCADGAEGYPPAAPYDRLIATVGVWDLAPSWLDQLAPGGRLVVPLDLHGAQCSVALERAGDGTHWVSRSVRPCGFMRMRGVLAGPEQIRMLDRDSRLVLEVPDRREIDDDAVLSMLDGPAVEVSTGSAVDGMAAFDLGLWLSVREPRACRLAESGSAARQRLSAVPVRFQDMRITVAVVDATGLAVLGQRSDGQLLALGYGPARAQRAAELVDHVRAWDAAGRPSAERLSITAGPRDGEHQGHITKTYTTLEVTWSDVV